MVDAKWATQLWGRVGHGVMQCSTTPLHDPAPLVRAGRRTADLWQQAAERRNRTCAAAKSADAMTNHIVVMWTRRRPVEGASLSFWARNCAGATVATRGARFGARDTKRFGGSSA